MDDVLAYIDVAEAPAAYRSASADEQAWRGRLFLMTWILTGHETYAWAIALADDLDGDTKRVVHSIEDASIFAALRYVGHVRPRDGSRLHA